jgi:hypothetical protein
MWIIPAPRVRRWDADLLEEADDFMAVSGLGPVLSQCLADL